MLDYQMIAPNKRADYLPYLRLADEEVGMIRRYLNDGQLYSIHLAGQSTVIGVMHVTFVDQTQVELKNIALLPAYRNQGYGQQALNDLKQMMVAQGYRTLLVGTGDGSLAAIGFYLRQGFRFDHIRKNFFEQYQQPIIENGIRLQDMVMLSQPL
ncbi:GNAT family N-acetyltransferase [Latilactobacillus sakei]|uniref:GNAT family N-acetyltransferase n=1 Tax=Latilactobacillus sakei TaxID=1599 RepID=A0AAF0GPQ3_LATSK|nr:GNAT family N-acetyltransferase [Latilactobacillus sakei]MDM5043589.1 GNAT family N-acetyltransferase [Latilactobacillus sakei]MDR7924024.1 GNAT family N-acetyltransferase [Latilactobacillus sakei subsp. sakei]QGL60190.1 GNAT family N-acetyltransferase [Latilactobacillus sakei]USS38376.1 GNAT family N-acetyltransferase [Latilactobacillus sakei]WEY50070.1 GNAT family N-acetyltransferase [Latilactobacillus sakei]